jgi:ankyrin repeat protein
MSIDFTKPITSEEDDKMFLDVFKKYANDPEFTDPFIGNIFPQNIEWQEFSRQKIFEEVDAYNKAKIVVESDPKMYKRNEAMIKKFLNLDTHQANIRNALNTPDYIGDSPLKLAFDQIFFRPEKVLEDVKKILELGGKDFSNKYDVTVLFLASQKGMIDVVKLLVDHGSDVNLSNSDNLNEAEETPLLVAIGNTDYKQSPHFKINYYEVVQYLVEHGAIIDDSVMNKAHENIDSDEGYRIFQYLLNKFNSQNN